MAFVWHTHLMLDQIVVSFSSKKQFLILNLPSNNSSYLIANSQKLVNITSQNINKMAFIQMKMTKIHRKLNPNGQQIPKLFLKKFNWNKLFWAKLELLHKFWRTYQWLWTWKMNQKNKIVRRSRRQFQLIAKCSDFSLWSYSFQIQTNWWAQSKFSIHFCC